MGLAGTALGRLVAVGAGVRDGTRVGSDPAGARVAVGCRVALGRGLGVAPRAGVIFVGGIMRVGLASMLGVTSSEAGPGVTVATDVRGSGPPGTLSPR